MQYYSIKVGISGDVTQQEIMDILRNAGAEVIQTSDGVALKTEKTLPELKQSHDKLSSLNFETLNPKEVQSNSEIPTDIRTFVEG